MQSRALPPINFWFSCKNIFIFLLSVGLLSLSLPAANAATHINVTGNFGAAAVGSPYSVTLTASGGTAPYTFTLSWGQLPAGLALGATTGVVYGTPSAAGTYNFGIYVTDSKGHGGSQRFQITVSAAIVVTVSPSTATVVSGGSVSFAASVANSSNQTVTWSANSGTVSSSGLYQAPGVKANSSATVTATSTADPTKSASASVTITALPLTLSGNFVAAQVGIGYSVALSVGGGTAPFTFSLSSGQLPPGLTLGTSNGSISGIPTTTGTYSFAVTATDVNRVTGSQTFSITVSPAVVVTVTPITATVQSAGNISFAASVANSSNQGVTWSATSGSISSSGVYQAPSVKANSSATVTATSSADPTKSASAAVSITAMPLTLSGTFNPAQVGIGYSVPLAVGGGTAPFTFSLSSGQLPGAVVLGTSSGIVSGTPTSTGTFNFAVSVTDVNNVSGSQTFQVTVSPAVAITISPTTGTVQSGASLSFTDTVTNSSNQGVTWSATSGTVSSAGVYQAPSVKSNSTATVTVTSVADSTKSASATVTITPIPLTLSANFAPAQIGFTYSVPLTVGGGTAPYTFAISSGQLPAGLALGTTTGIVSGSPTASGTFNFGVNVTDSNSVGGSQTFTITVSPAVVVTITPATATVQSAGTVSLTALVTNTPNTAVTWAATLGTVSATGLYQASTVSADSTATITVTSTADPTKSAVALVTITPPPPPPLVITTSSLSAATAGISYLDTLGATGGKAPYNWSLAAGSLPGGISLQSAGSLSGTATQPGLFNLTLQVTDSSSPAQFTSQAFTLTVNSSTGNGAANITLFGFTENNTSASNFPTVHFAVQRFWDSPPLQWPSLNTAFGVFDFTNLDSELATGYTNGVTQGMYTLARTPPWATSAPSDTSCNYTTAKSGGGGGECDAPSDLSPDGSGTDAIWKAWITAIATHVNDPTYLQTHAHITYWEIWNEPDTAAFWAGTIAQLARLTEDANCIITGRGVIHQNGNGSATSCTAKAIDPTAQIVMASAHAKGVALTFGQNELYCNANPSPYQLPCPNPTNAIASAVDIINFHMKPGNETGNNCPSPTPCTPESAMQMYVSNIKGMLEPEELLKPLWNGEAAYSKSGFTDAYTDADMKASFMPRYYLINWSLGISALHWYTWESLEPTSVQTAYQQTYSWLYGSSLTTPCAAAGSVWSCTINKSGTNYLILWDTAQSCANGSCTTANQVVSPNWTQYQDMTSASKPIGISGSVVPVGIKPVVLH
jgi:hypothetical protein